jgi:hypothetical protein
MRGQKAIDRATKFLGAFLATGVRHGCRSVGMFVETHPEFGEHRFNQWCVRGSNHEGEHGNGESDDGLLTWEGP